MKINIKRFQEVLRKATLNFTIPTVQVTMTKDKVVSKMRSPTNDVVVLLESDNDVVTGISDNDTVELNFEEPASKVKPYLALIDADEADLTVNDEKIIVKVGRHKTNLHLHLPSYVTTFNGNKPSPPTFYEIELTEPVKHMFNSIRKVAGKFDKVYFKVVDKKFIIETTDGTNRFSNGISFELGDVDHKDISILFAFKNFNSLLMVINDDFEDFKAKFSWLDTSNAGMVSFEKDDGSETYYLLSKLEG